MIRSLSVIILGTVLIWPVSANAQRGGGGARGGGTAARGNAPAAARSARQGGATIGTLGSTVNRAPQGGALGTPGAPGPWVGGVPLGTGAVARNGRAGGRVSDVGIIQDYGAPYSVYPGIYPGYYGIPTFSTGFDTGYYPQGQWPSPVVSSPIYPVPYYPEPALVPGVTTPQEAALAEELARISQQLQELRNQVAPQGPEPVPQAQGAPAAQRASEKPSMPTVLIMRDGRRIETQSYAIADQTLFVFDQGTSQRFSMSDLDLEATQKENMKRGIRFLM